MHTLASAYILLLLLLYLFIHFIHGTRNNYTQNLQHRRLKAYLEDDDCNDECRAESSTIKLLSKKCNLLLAESYLRFFFYFSWRGWHLFEEIRYLWHKSWHKLSFFCSQLIFGSVEWNHWLLGKRFCFVDSGKHFSNFSQSLALHCVLACFWNNWFHIFIENLILGFHFSHHPR